MPPTSRRSSIASLRRASIDSIRSIKDFLTGRRRSSTVSFDHSVSEDYLIGCVRQNVKALASESVLDYDGRDLKRIENDSQYVRRFLGEKLKEYQDENDIIEQTTKSIMECLKWR